MLNPCLPAPRRRVQTARNPVDVILHARSASHLRRILHYEWTQDTNYTGSKGGKWIDSETKKARYQANKPGEGRKKKEETAPAEGGKVKAKKVKVDHNAVGDQIEKMISGDFSDEDIGTLKQSLQGMTVAQLGELKKRFGVKGGKVKADLQAGLAGHVEGKRKAAPAPAPEPAPEPAPAAVDPERQARINAYRERAQAKKPMFEKPQQTARASTPESRAAEPTPSPQQKQAASAAIVKAIGNAPVVSIAELRDKMPPELQGRAFDEAVFDLHDSQQAQASSDRDIVNAKPGDISDGETAFTTLTLNTPPQQAEIGVPSSEVPGSPVQTPPRLPPDPRGERSRSGLGQAPKVQPRPATSSVLPAGKAQAKQRGGQKPTAFEKREAAQKANRERDGRRTNDEMPPRKPPGVNGASTQKDRDRLDEMIQRSKDPNALSNADVASAVAEFSKLSLPELRDLATGVDLANFKNTKGDILKRLGLKMTEVRRAHESIEV